MNTKRPLGIAAVVLSLFAPFAAGCSSNDDTSAAVDTQPTTSVAATTSATSTAGIRLVSASEGAAIQTNPPEDLVILDVRTPEEFAEAHLDGAVMIDFYRDDFAEQLAGLDPDVPYLLYCRSGNRSGQTAAIMEKLGFSDVADVDGGINAWNGSGLPTVTP